MQIARFPTSVNDAAHMLQPYSDQPGYLTDAFAQVEYLPGTEREIALAKKLLRRAAEQIRADRRGGDAAIFKANRSAAADTAGKGPPAAGP